MKASSLSALLVALLATPQSSLGRSIPRNIRSGDEPNGHDVAYWRHATTNRCTDNPCRNLELGSALNNPSKRAGTPPPVPKPIVKPGAGGAGGAGGGAGAGGVGKGGAGVGAGGAGVGAGGVRPPPGGAAPGAPAGGAPGTPAGQGLGAPYGQAPGTGAAPRPVPAPAPVGGAAPAPAPAPVGGAAGGVAPAPVPVGGAAGGAAPAGGIANPVMAGGVKRPLNSPGQGQPDPKFPKPGDSSSGSSSGGSPPAGPSQPRPPANPAPGAPAGGRPITVFNPPGGGAPRPRDPPAGQVPRGPDGFPVATGRNPQFVIDRNRNGPVDLTTKGYKTTAEDAEFDESMYEVFNSAGFRVAMVEAKKSEGISVVKDLRFQQELDKNGKVRSEGDKTPQHARAFEAIAHTWTRDAGQPMNKMKALDFDAVENDGTRAVLERLLNGRESVTITRAANPREFQEVLDTPLGRIGDDIVSFTPINKQVDRFELQRVRADIDPDEIGDNPVPAFQVHFA
ncbi:hypothetical protein QBC34DRAFT_385384 [Podospora aff. communis PSN243]|uniref:Uncharacterized protein n=1 Tax=Podospora aff. communis PSN243 TaxID=3040156 RepID=A0AAV9GA07_9PEZI|nr:hypothetical protein QBC34DRAFT_385384 [Podospora aff. communis PSN243]